MCSHIGKVFHEPYCKSCSDNSKRGHYSKKGDLVKPRQHKRWKLMQTRKCTFLASTTLEAMSLDICQVCLGCFAGCGVEAAIATRH